MLICLGQRYTSIIHETHIVVQVTFIISCSNHSINILLRHWKRQDSVSVSLQVYKECLLAMRDARNSNASTDLTYTINIIALCDVGLEMS